MKSYIKQEIIINELGSNISGKTQFLKKIERLFTVDDEWLMATHDPIGLELHKMASILKTYKRYSEKLYQIFQE